MDVPAETLAELKCHKCEMYLSRGPVYLEHGGAAACGLCFSPKRPATRNKEYEAVAKLLRFPCKNRDLGCGETVGFEEVAHEVTCSYRQYVCPVLGSSRCEWLGTRSQLLQHCQDQHPDHVLDNPCSLTHDIATSSLHNYLLQAFQMLFLLLTKVCVTSGRIYHSVRLLDSDDMAQDFRYKLHVRRGDEELTKRGDVAPGGCLALQEPTALGLDVNSLLSVLGGWGGATCTVAVERRGRQQETVVQGEQQEPVAVKEPEPVAVEEPEPVAVEEPEPVAVEEPEPVAVEEPEPVAVEEPEPVAVEEPEPVAVEEPEPVAVEEPEPVAVEEPEPVAVEEPEPVAVEEPEPVAVEEPEPVAVEEPEPVAVEEPEPVAMEEPEPVAVEEPEPVAVEEPEPVAVEEPEPVAVEEPEPVAVEEPEPVAVEEPEPVAVEEPEPVAVEEPEPVAVEEPEPVAVEEPEPVAVEEPEPVAVEEPEPVAVEEPEPVAVEEPEPVAVEEPEPVAVEEPEPVAVEEPEPVAVEEPEPVAMERQEKCSRCGAEVTVKLYRDEDGWRCERCAPTREACGNQAQGCTHQDIPDKCIKHDWYFCQQSTRCYICHEDVSRGTLSRHYTSSHRDVTHGAGFTWRATRIGERGRRCLVTCPAGTAMCFYRLDDSGFILRVYIPVSSKRLCEFRCEIRVTQPSTGLTHTCTPDVSYKDQCDWSIKIKDGFPSWTCEFDVSVNICKLQK